MIELVRTVRTPLAVREAADYLSDFRSTAEWDPHTAHCERLDVGPLRVGSVFDNTQRMGPLRTTLRYTVEEYRPGSSIRLHCSSRTLTSTDAMAYAADSDGTTVTYTLRLALKGPLRFTEPRVRVLLERLADDAAAGMKRALDARVGVS